MKCLFAGINAIDSHGPRTVRKRRMGRSGARMSHRHILPSMVPIARTFELSSDQDNAVVVLPIPGMLHLRTWILRSNIRVCVPEERANVLGRLEDNARRTLEADCSP